MYELVRRAVPRQVIASTAERPSIDKLRAMIGPSAKELSDGALKHLQRGGGLELPVITAYELKRIKTS